MGIPYAEVIGDPIAHSKSPLVHKFWLEKLGIEGDYRAVPVSSGELDGYFSSRRGDPDWRGCNVTIPHKQAIMPFLDESRVYATDAINCVVPENGRLIGFNTDGSAVGIAMDSGIDTSEPVCIIGAGGAANAAVAELDILAVYQFNVIARDPAKARALVEPYGKYGKVYGFDQAAEALRNGVALINASPLGMEGFDPMPDSVLAGLDGLSRDAFVLDMVYAPVRTELLRRAGQQGLRTIDGLTMLIAQAGLAFRRFFGTDAPRGDDRELREILER